MRALVLLFTCVLYAADVPKWSRFEAAFESPEPFGADVRFTFRSPSGVSRTVFAFWDGGLTWRVRFTPNEEGRWTYTSPRLSGEFRCTRPRAGTLFERHGPVRLSADRVRLVHDDGTPFFWLADTAWNGPLLASGADWEWYLRKRAAQGFTAIQWVTTQWRGAPEAGPAYTGRESIRVNPEFFRRLDEKSQAIARAGLLSVPVMLWAIASRSGSEVNPGVSLSEDQAILLARYMLARWGAGPVVWFLNGDGDYRGPLADKWKRIGRGVFGDVWHAPVSLHPGGRMWVMEEFRDEPWLDIAGYQSAHADSDGNSAWITSGPPAREWARAPVRPVISIEAPYETPGNDAVVRRNHLWSLLNAPLAGISYGAHAIWAWSDGVHPPAGHGDRVHPHWKSMIDAPAAVQMGRIRKILEGLNWTELRPAEPLVAEPPARFVPVMRGGSTVLAYLPAGSGAVALKASSAHWIDPRTGRRRPAAAPFTPPDGNDWILVARSK